jgi:hypothetical protein
MMPVEEPQETSSNYDPQLVYTPPVGRLPVLGKMRAEIDKLRASTDDDRNQIENRDKTQLLDNLKILAEIAALENKTEAEVELLNQKTVTELSQTSDYIPDGIGHNTSTDVQGIHEKQKGLFQKQTDGFDRDAEQKLAKIFADTWSVRQTTDGALAGEAGLSEGEVRTVLDHARNGINLGNADIDHTPTPLVFTPEVGAAISTEYESNQVAVAGIAPNQALAPISITNGEYSLNGADYTSDPGDVNLGDTIKVKGTSSDQAATKVIISVLIGDVTSEYSITTA